MELELTVEADAAAGLSRLKVLAASRNGRPRGQSIKIVWHDNPEHALLADGLTMAEQRGAWRLERIVPGAQTWLPAQPAPVVAEDPDMGTLPSPLAPLAAFEGRLTTTVHQFGGQPVTLAVAKGILRAVTAEQAVGRIWLSGEENAVREAALAIAGALPVTVPLASLAAQAIALATGRPAQARHQGAPILPHGTTSLADGLAHIVGHLTDVVLAHAPAAMAKHDVGPEAVHQMRVAVRRARSALAIFRRAVVPNALDPVNAQLKELGTLLGPTRDWDVFATETAPAIQRAMADDDRLGRLVVAAARRRRDCQKALAAYLETPAFRALGIELAWFASASSWRPATMLDGEGNSPPTLEDFAGQVLQHNWKKLLSSGKHIEELDIPSLHKVRLRAKRARYAAEMFGALYHGKAPHRFVRRLSVVQQRLGILNDGAVATHLLDELGGVGGRHAYATGLVTGFMAQRAAGMRPRIVQAFDKFRRQAPYWT